MQEYLQARRLPGRFTDSVRACPARQSPARRPAAPVPVCKSKLAISLAYPSRVVAPVRCPALVAAVLAPVPVSAGWFRLRSCRRFPLFHVPLLLALLVSLFGPASGSSCRLRRPWPAHLPPPTARRAWSRTTPGWPAPDARRHENSTPARARCNLGPPGGVSGPAAPWPGRPALRCATSPVNRSRPRAATPSAWAGPGRFRRAPPNPAPPPADRLPPSPRCTRSHKAACPPPPAAAPAGRSRPRRHRAAAAPG